MMWEYLKSIVLGLLVTISLLVTFALWTYQPEYDELNNGENILEVETKLTNGMQQSLTSIINPELLLFHQNGRHFTLDEWSKSKTLYDNILTWPLTDFSEIERGSGIEKDSAIEIIYPTGIPLSTLANTFTLNEEIEEILDSSFIVDRIFISLAPNESNNYVYFVSDDNSNIQVRAMLRYNVYDNVDKYLVDSEVQREYFNAFEDREVPIYLPEAQVTLPKEQLQGGNIEVDTMKNILFNNPQLVKRNATTNGTFYNSDNRLLQIGPGDMHMRFQQFQSEDSQPLSRGDIIKQSIDDINDHNGWTDESYRLFNIDSSDNTIDFRDYKNGYPVLDQNELGHITQMWSNQDLIEYRRPLVRVKYNLGSEQKSLPSGRDVLSYIEENRDRSVYLIEDIKIGYTMKVKSFLVIYMTPAWFIKEGGEWKEIDFEGAMNNAVGSN